MERNLALDGLRGCAAFIVIFFHSILGIDAGFPKKIWWVPYYKLESWYDRLAKLVLIFFNGELAVLIFFVISGAVLFESLKRSQKDFLDLGIDFCIKRIFRLFPALIVCLIAFYFIFLLLHLFWPQIFHVYSLKQFITNALLFNTEMHGASWTLQVEMLVIPFTLIAFYLFRRYGTRGLLCFLIFSLLATHKGRLVMHSVLLKRNLFYFALGFLIPCVDKRYFSIFKSYHHFIIFLILGFIFYLNFKSNYFVLVIQGICLFSFVGSLYHHTSNSINKFFQTKCMVYLGKISYSYYLMNVIFLNIFLRLMITHTPALNHYIEFGILTGILTALVSIPISHLTEKYVELPFIKLGAKIVSFRGRFSRFQNRILVE